MPYEKTYEENLRILDKSVKYLEIELRLGEVMCFDCHTMTSKQHEEEHDLR